MKNKYVVLHKGRRREVESETVSSELGTWRFKNGDELIAEFALSGGLSIIRDMSHLDAVTTTDDENATEFELWTQGRKFLILCDHIEVDDYSRLFNLGGMLVAMCTLYGGYDLIKSRDVIVRGIGE